MENELLVKQELLSLINNIDNNRINNVLKKILFDSTQDWDKIYNELIQAFPDIKDKCEKNEAIKIASKISDIIIPYIGLYATVNVASDCYPYEVIKINSDKEIIIRKMKIKMLKQENFNCYYQFYSNFEGIMLTATLRKNNIWKTTTTNFVVDLGAAMYRMDPDF